MRRIKIRNTEFHEPRSEWLALRLSVKEKRKIIEHAKNSGLNVSDFIRQRVCYNTPDLMQQITDNYAQSLQIKGLERGLPI